MLNDLPSIPVVFGGDDELSHDDVEKLREAYFEALENAGIMFLDYESIGNGQYQAHVKSKYANMPVADMQDFIEKES